MESEKVIEVPSRRFGKYRVRSRLGAGGMAEVFLAEAVNEVGEQINVALKLMKKDVSPDVFNDEADLMGLLSHPNLVQRLEIGNAFGRPFIAMEFLIGGDLEALVAVHRRETKEVPRAIAIHVVIEVLRALAYFHQAKTRTGTALHLVHGDVNPANVFFSDGGEVKLGDFGVAKSRAVAIGPGENVTAGKLHYLSPEQIYGEQLTSASDLFAVGIMLHELLFGQHPFVARLKTPGTEAVMDALRAAKLSLPDSVDKPLKEILKRALAAEVKPRYRTAGEFAGDLFRYALDNNLCATRGDVQAWLESMLGLLV